MNMPDYLKRFRRAFQFHNVACALVMIFVYRGFVEILREVMLSTDQIQIVALLFASAATFLFSGIYKSFLKD